ncbi:MAG: hypothetical protein ACKOPG_11120 [Novosphingobium sp.]
MSIYAVLILGFVGALWWYNHQRQKRLDADPGQHELAALMIKAATGQGIGKAQVAGHLNRLAKGGADRRVRLTHAVMLVRSEAVPELYARVLNLSREL